MSKENSINTMSKEMMQGCSLVNREWTVLIVDYDLNCLMELEEMLQYYNFKVTKCRYAKDAISMLQDDRNRFDIVITDLKLPDMDGFELLRCIGLDMDLPVIMTSTDDDEDLIRKGLTYGACDYLLKPIQMENVKHLWKYAYRKRRHEEGLIKGVVQSAGSSSSDVINMNESSTWENYCQKMNTNTSKIENSVAASSDGEGNGKCMKKRKHVSNNNGDPKVKDDATTKKKQRVIWTTALHAKFMAAINQIGTAKAVPKKILEIMNVPGLTRENVASHLQKYRLFCKRFGQTPQYQSEGMNLMCTPEESIQEISPIDMHNVQTQVIPTSSSLQVRSFTSLNTHSQIEVSKIGLRSHQQPQSINTLSNGNGEQIASETNTNIRFPHQVEGGNIFYHPVVSYAYVKSEVGLDTFVTGETTSIGGQPFRFGDISQTRVAGNTYENHLLDLGYNDAALYFGQFDHDYAIRRLS